MKKLFNLIESGYLPAIALISLGISIADLFGLFNISTWMSHNVPTITLLLVALALTPLAIVQFKQTGLQQDVINMQDAIQRLATRRDIDILQHHIQQVLANIELENMKYSLTMINTNLSKVFDNSFSTWAESIKIALHEQRVRVEIQQFLYYYKRTLFVFPDATFFATSLFSELHLWKDAGVEEAITKFTQKGGHMKRIFFLRSGDQDTPEARDILDRQLRMGVEVYTVTSHLIPTPFKKLFLVDSQGRIAWEEPFYSEAMLQLGSVFATANPHDTMEFCRIFETLIRDEAILYKN